MVVLLGSKLKDEVQMIKQDVVQIYSIGRDSGILTMDTRWEVTLGYLSVMIPGSTVYCSGAASIAAFTLPRPLPGNAALPSEGKFLRARAAISACAESSGGDVASAANPR